jgi:hypothetical protein
MNAVLDNLLVGAVLLASVGYAVYKLGPRTLRKRIVVALSTALAAAPPFLKLGAAAQRLGASAGKAQGACGGCDNCGSESAAAPSASAEVKIPVGKIGRRA